jgi:Leucine-rich repeat (LRR) protein
MKSLAFVALIFLPPYFPLGKVAPTGGVLAAVTPLVVSWDSTSVASSLQSCGLDPLIFDLTSLQFLDLSMNYFIRLPAVGFERLTFLTHINLSNYHFGGEIPLGIGKLVNLISLDISSSYDIMRDFQCNGEMDSLLLVSNFQNRMGNLSNLRELYLDYVTIYNDGEEWCTSLGKTVPRLEVLSLVTCQLYGPVHQCLSSLSSLTVISLQGNSNIFAGRFPDFSMDFENLTVLQLSNNNFQGWFPRRIFQSKKLRVLDLSGNMDLPGSLPSFSDARYLHSFRLDETNFSLF